MYNFIYVCFILLYLKPFKGSHLPAEAFAEATDQVTASYQARQMKTTRYGYHWLPFLQYSWHSCFFFVENYLNEKET